MRLSTAICHHTFLETSDTWLSNFTRSSMLTPSISKWKFMGGMMVFSHLKLKSVCFLFYPWQWLGIYGLVYLDFWYFACFIWYFASNIHVGAAGRGLFTKYLLIMYNFLFSNIMRGFRVPRLVLVVIIPRQNMSLSEKPLALTILK